MARSLTELQKQYNSSASAEKRGMPMMRGPGGPRGMGKGKPKNTKNTIKRLFQYVGHYKVQLVCVLFLMLVSTVTSLIGSFMLAPIINKLVLYVSPNEAANLSLMERFSDNVISSFANTLSGALESVAPNMSSARSWCISPQRLPFLSACISSVLLQRIYRTA